MRTSRLLTSRSPETKGHACDLLERQEIEDIARGSAVLGTGGGGDPYLGKLAAIQAIKTYGPLQLATIDDLPDDMLVAFPFAIGSPVPFLERITIEPRAGHRLPGDEPLPRPADRRGDVDRDRRHELGRPLRGRPRARVCR